MPSRFPPHGYFLVSAVFHYLGPALAVLLFARVEPLGVAWLRIAIAGAVFLLWLRPWRILRRADARTWRLLIIWGAVLATMNSLFYLAIDRLPLGTVAAIEFLPVIVLAAIAVRTPRNAIALVLAVAGVYLVTDVAWTIDPLGLAFAAGNAALFAAYIVVAHRAANTGTLTGIQSLGAAMLIAAVACLPFGIGGALPALTSPALLGAAAAVAVCSSVVPYVCDQLAMARLSRGAYSLMTSLLPATAAVIGIVVLDQIPTATEVLGIALVAAGVAAHRERS